MSKLRSPFSFYGLAEVSDAAISEHLSRIIEDQVHQLCVAACTVCNDVRLFCVGVWQQRLLILQGMTLEPLPLGRIASHYYLSVRSVAMIRDNLKPNSSIIEVNGHGTRFEKNHASLQVLRLLCDMPEYDEVPVRHNEDIVNKNLSQHCPLVATTNTRSFDDPHTKVHLLYQVRALIVKNMGRK